MCDNADIFRSNSLVSIARRFNIHVGNQLTLQPSVGRQTRACNLFDLVELVKSTARGVSVACSTKARSETSIQNDNYKKKVMISESTVSSETFYSNDQTYNQYLQNHPSPCHSFEYDRKSHICRSSSHNYH